jgi:hypothetical protein
MRVRGSAWNPRFSDGSLALRQSCGAMPARPRTRSGRGHRHARRPGLYCKRVLGLPGGGDRLSKRRPAHQRLHAREPYLADPVRGMWTIRSLGPRRVLCGRATTAACPCRTRWRGWWNERASRGALVMKHAPPGGPSSSLGGGVAGPSARCCPAKRPNACARPGPSCSPCAGTETALPAGRSPAGRWSCNPSSRRVRASKWALPTPDHHRAASCRVC